MSKPPSLAGLAAVVAVGAICYGLGTGFVRLGPPDAESRSRPGSVLAPLAAVEASRAAPNRTPAPLDPGVGRAEALVPSPLLVAASAVGAPPTPGAVLAASKVKDAIRDGVKKAVLETNPLLDSDAAIKAAVDAGKVLAFDPSDAGAKLTAVARRAADTAGREAAQKAVDKAVTDAIAAELKKTPPPEEAAVVDAAVKAAGESVESAAAEAVDAARNAALEAVRDRAAELAFKRVDFAPDEIKLQYMKADNTFADFDSTGASEPLDGPEAVVRALVRLKRPGDAKKPGRRYDDSGATVTVEVLPVSSEVPPYLALPSVTEPNAQGDARIVAELDSKAVRLTVREAGSYDLRVTLTPAAGSPFSTTLRFRLQAKDQPVPRINALKQVQGDRDVTVDVELGNTPVALQGGTLTLSANVPLGKRQLLVVNADRNEGVKNPAGAVDSVKAETAGQSVDLPVVLDPASLLDQPTRLVVVDQWSRRRSEPVTVLIPTGGLPSTTTGIRASTGENAVFSEYTAPRTVPEGFKPSDKVETRVVRLYYYRDAHRVAQIVNRNVRSFNRVAVDTRRRMADRARDEADVRTDARASQESRAVRAAQASRSAEARYRQAQADLDAALGQERQARQDGPVIDAQLKDAADLVTQQDVAVNTLQTQLNATDAQKNPDEFTRLTAELVQARVRRQQFTANQAALQQQKTESQRLTSAVPPSDSLRQKVEQARTDLERVRSSEAAASDATLQDQQLEDRARENQFRQEVAAAHEDPDTYVAGVPGSTDPVLQVSVSVIGEGEIQLRGPIKGINVIRTMINQIDAPVGQVRVGVHTIQINGERGDRMEKVATRIQDYVDHSRFLTAQSAQLLRNAVVKVASRRAQEAAAACAAAGQTSTQAREAKYREAFFGRDFIEELAEIDSEFLVGGNKLLSLHSMDTTSLASALFLIALAKNDTRMEVLAEFQRMLQFDLPPAEARYYQAGAIGRAKDHHREFQMLACNARFQSFFGFFNAEVAGSETLNPLQREFLKLAQIFKSRLVTEMEFNQRVKERGLIEDRIDPIVDRKIASANEKEALDKRARAFEQLLTQRATVLTELAESEQKLRESEDRVAQVIQGLTYHIARTGTVEVAGTSRQLTSLSKLLVTAPDAESAERSLVGDGVVPFRIPSQDNLLLLPTNAATGRTVAPLTADQVREVKKYLGGLIAKELDSFDILFNFYFTDRDYRDLTRARTVVRGLPRESLPDDLVELGKIAATVGAQGVVILRVANTVRENIQSIGQSSRELVRLLSADVPEARRLYQAWVDVRDRVRHTLREGEDYRRSAEIQINDLEMGFRAILSSFLDYENQTRIAEFKRRPLDHKRLLDMLIDDVEDKYIELLEGTRAHTANIDAYIKSIATALDDDFNTQFYYPAFAEIRRASRYYDVTLGKIETTNVLANNRGFAKVSPQATMEFDLPKRDILINEAMNGALAMTKDFGALVADPNFLALAQLRSGQPTSSLEPGASVGVNSVRNVLPGLSRANDEKLLSQQGAGRAGFGSAMEALIPDPAVYKFETGTGFEIRPVVQPDGQAVVFHFNYMYTTNVREPVRADEKHLGRVKRHFIDTDVQLGNYELREVSRYQVGLKAARTSRGVPLFEDIPGLGILFRPLPSAESSLQENIVLAQSTIFPTLFDLMGLRWAPAVADLDTLRLRNDDFVVRHRARDVANHVFDISASQVDEFLRVPGAERRPDLYRPQTTIPDVHPDGYRGPGLNYRDSQLREGYDPTTLTPESRYVPGASRGAYPPPPDTGEEAGMVVGRRDPRDQPVADAVGGPPAIAGRPAPDDRRTPGVRPGAAPSPGFRPSSPPVAPRMRSPTSAPADGRTSWNPPAAGASRPSPTTSSSTVIRDPAVARTSATRSAAPIPIPLPPLPPSPSPSPSPSPTPKLAPTAPPPTRPAATPARGFLSRFRGRSDPSTTR